MPLRSAILVCGLLAFSSLAEAREFGGYECTDDCSEHRAGYEWAEQLRLTDETQCEQIIIRMPKRTSFYEGCLVFIEDPSRGADEDDDGEQID